MDNGKPKKNLVISIITAPYRVLCKAKDFYFRSIMDCANHTTYGRAAMIGSHLPRSYSMSTTSNDSAAEDLRELIRANSTSTIADLNISRAELEVYIKQHMIRQTRSASVGMARIDEDPPVPISGDTKVKSDGLRSRSYGGISAAKINRFLDA